MKTTYSESVGVRYILRPLFIVVLSSCLAVAAGDLIGALVTAIRPSLFIAIGALAALESAYAYLFLEAPQISHADRWRQRALEILALCLISKAARYFGWTRGAIVADLARWPLDPLAFFDAPTIAASLLAILIWHTTRHSLSDIDALGEPPDRDTAYVPPQQRLIGRFLGGGLALLGCAGAVHNQWPGITFVAPPPMLHSLLNAAVYFISGLVFLSHIHFTRLLQRWTEQHLSLAPEVPRRWLVYSVLFIGLSMALALILPSGYTLNLLEVLSGVLAVVIYFIQLFLWLLVAGASWLLHLYFKDTPLPWQPPAAEPPPPTEPASTATVTFTWAQLTQSLAFWIVLVSGIIYLLISLLNDQPEWRRFLERLAPRRLLRRVWEVLRRRLGGWRAQALRRITPRGRRTSAPAEEHSRTTFMLPRPGRLSPREQIRYYYLAVVQRAGVAGFPRRPTQSPGEYQPILEAHLPEWQQEIAHLTAAFIAARYSAQPLDTAQAHGARAAWQRLRAALGVLGRRQRR